MLTSVSNVLRVSILFTRSDLKTVLIPVTIFSFLAVPNASVVGVLLGVLWTWMNLLQFCIAGQVKNPGEDKLNKPWRPIPSALIDVPSAQSMRWYLLPTCGILSFCLGAAWPALFLNVAFLLHNEFEYDSHWLHRSILNAWGYAMFNAGAVAVVSRGAPLDISTIISIAINALIIATTIHAQDFRDVEGDRLCGRETLPILFPEGSRITLPLIVLMWTGLTGVASGLALTPLIAIFLLAFIVGARFYLLRTHQGDLTSYSIYNMWLATIQVAHLPYATTNLRSFNHANVIAALRYLCTPTRAGCAVVSSGQT